MLQLEAKNDAQSICPHCNIALYTVCMRKLTITRAWVNHLIVDLGIMLIDHKILFGRYI